MGLGMCCAAHVSATPWTFLTCSSRSASVPTSDDQVHSWNAQKTRGQFSPESTFSARAWGGINGCARIWVFAKCFSASSSFLLGWVESGATGILLSSSRRFKFSSSGRGSSPRWAPEWSGGSGRWGSRGCSVAWLRTAVLLRLGGRGCGWGAGGGGGEFAGSSAVCASPGTRGSGWLGTSRS